MIKPDRTHAIAMEFPVTPSNAINYWNARGVRIVWDGTNHPTVTATSPRLQGMDAVDLERDLAMLKAARQFQSTPTNPTSNVVRPIQFAQSIDHKFAHTRLAGRLSRSSNVQWREIGGRRLAIITEPMTPTVYVLGAPMVRMTDGTDNPVAA